MSSGYFYWNNQELDILKDYKGNYKTLQELQEAIFACSGNLRSMGSISARLSIEGITSMNSRWSECEDKILIDSYTANKGLVLADVFNKLDRSKNSIRSRMTILKKLGRV